MIINSNINKRKNIITPEHFGAIPYMKPLDGRVINNINFPLINYYPLGNGTTRISSTLPNTFTEEDLNKTFCGLFNHLNPEIPDYNRVDEFFPAIVSSRYSTIIEVEDEQNIIVDFEYNGGDDNNPQIQINGKGYIFFDNSDNFINLFNEAFNLNNKSSILILKPFEVKDNFLTTCYVIPEIKRNMVKNSGFTITSKIKNKNARIKIGIEDLYDLENLFGSTIYRQHKLLFTNRGGYDYNFIVNDIDIIPPHRSIKHCRTYSVGLYEGLVPPNSRRTGVTAFINLNNDLEQKEINNGIIGITEENFFMTSTTSDRGGTPTGDNELFSDIYKFHYLYFNKFKFVGASSASAMNTNLQGGGSFLVLDDGSCDYNPEVSFNVPNEEVFIKISQDKTNLPIIFNSEYFSNNVLEIDGKGNFLKTAVNFGNRNTYAFIKRDDTDLKPFCFLVQSLEMNTFNNYYTWCYFPRDEKPSWGNTIPNLTAKKNQVFFDIPVVGERYVIGRDYSINKSSAGLERGEIPTPTVNQNNFIRTAICWSTILQKGAIDFNVEEEIPQNGKPIEFQIGDQFKIIGDTTEETYTILEKLSGVFPAWGYEFIFRQPNQTGAKGGRKSFNYMRLKLDKDLPEDIDLTFEVEIVRSTSQVLLDGVSREAFHVYRGNASLLLNNSTNFYTTGYRRGDGLGHLAYTQAEVGKFFRNVDFNNSFWRENNGTYSFTPFIINNTTVKPLRYYNKGITLINCTNFVVGEFAGNSATRNAFEQQRLIYESYDGDYLPEYVNRDGIPFPPKYRVYNTQNPTNINNIVNPSYSTEVFMSSDSAPDLPKPILNVLNRIKIALNK